VRKSATKRTKQGGDGPVGNTPGRKGVKRKGAEEEKKAEGD